MKKNLLYIVALILIAIGNNAFVYGQSCAQNGSTLDKLTERAWLSIPNIPTPDFQIIYK